MPGFDEIWLAGADGCASGWLVIFAEPDGLLAAPRVVANFSDIVHAEEARRYRHRHSCRSARTQPRQGAPARARRPPAAWRAQIERLSDSVATGRGCQHCLRAPDERQRFLRACEIVRMTSEDGKAFAKQGFYILDKVVEVDEFMRKHSQYIPSVYETHSELGFWRINGDRALSEAKKVKSRCHEPGLALRRRLLIAEGLPPEIVNADPPSGAGADDLLDALAWHGESMPVMRNLSLKNSNAIPTGCQWRSGRKLIRLWS